MRTTHHQLIAVLLLVGCGKPNETAPLLRDEPMPDQAGLTGVTVVPGTAERWWLKRGVGVVSTDARVVFADPTRYDDVVALDANRIVLIKRNDGFVYEVSTHRLLNRFCYLPEVIPNTTPDAWQQSFVVGWDAAEQRIYVQPQTFDVFGERMIDAQVGVFRADLSTPLEWQNVAERDMQAGGIAVVSRERIWLGWGPTLYLYDAKAQSLQKKATLEVTDISALAIDGDRLLVMDGPTQKLFSLPLDGLN